MSSEKWRLKNVGRFIQALCVTGLYLIRLDIVGFGRQTSAVSRLTRLDIEERQMALDSGFLGPQFLTWDILATGAAVGYQYLCLWLSYQYNICRQTCATLWLLGLGPQSIGDWGRTTVAIVVL